jgi:lactate permease
VVATQFNKHPAGVVARAWVPWLVLTVFVFAWGLPSVKNALDNTCSPSLPIGGPHPMVQKMPPVVAKPTTEGAV